MAPPSSTTIGKEIVNVVLRSQKQCDIAVDVKILGKPIDFEIPKVA